MSSRGFETIEHTADIGIRVWADTVGELFTAAGEGLSFLLISRDHLFLTEQRSIELQASDWGGLLYDWLAELLYLEEVHGFLPAEFKVLEIEPYRLRAQVIGDMYDETRHETLESIKAVTFHGLDVQEGPPWTVQVIFDV